MITIINEELFNVQNVESEVSETNKYRFTTTYSVSEKVICRGVNPTTGDIFERPYVRPILNLCYNDKSELDKQSNLGMKIAQNTKGKGDSMLPLQCTIDKAFGASYLFLIAIPFNGTLKAIPKSHDYRIYGGTIVKSQYKNIDFNGEKYRKILYLAISPNIILLADNLHTHYKDSIDIDILWFTKGGLMVDDGTNKINVKHTTTISISISDDCDKPLKYSVKNNAVYGEKLNKDEFKSSKIFEVYKIPVKNKKYY